MNSTPKIIKLGKQITPPVLAPYIRKFLRILRKRKPDWYMINNGPLKGYKLFVDPSEGCFDGELSGDYESFFETVLNNMSLEGKAIVDIGAHVGYHSMNFATKVGKDGIVYAFEPNTHTFKRLDFIIKGNHNVGQVKLFNKAVTKETGEIEFFFSPDIDGGGSVLSCTSDSFTPKDSRLKKTIVEGMSLDNFMESSLFISNVSPAVVKIDVEGAENMVLEGGRKFINKFKPVILVEIHSLLNLIKACEFAFSLNYDIKLLKEEVGPTHCFVSLIPSTY